MKYNDLEKPPGAILIEARASMRMGPGGSMSGWLYSQLPDFLK